MSQKVKVAVVGCGFVSSYYMETLQKFPNLELAGIFDIDPDRLRAQGSHYHAHMFRSYEDILNQDDIEIVVNLTDPKSHFEISGKALEAGKHVYTEKPFCTELSDCEKLVELAEKKGLFISSAPCSLLGPTAQTLWKAIRNKEIGEIWLNYAEMDDGPVFLMGPDNWRSATGVPWPYKGEFTMGSSLEHLGYTLSWLVAFFGPAIHVTSFSDCRVSNKMPDMDPVSAPDFSVAVIKHQSGVVSRVTCGIVAPLNRGLTLVGSTGTIRIRDFWDNYERPKKLRYSSLKLKAERKPWIDNNWILKKIFGLIPGKLSLKRNFHYNKLHHNNLDYCLGIYEMALAIQHGDRPILDADFSLHVNELTLKIHNSLDSGKVDIKHTFDHDGLVKRNLERIPD